MKDYTDALKTADKDNDAQFQKLLNEGIELIGLTDVELLREFGISKPTLERWKTGVSSPHPDMRPSIFDWLYGLAILDVEDEDDCSRVSGVE